jgi:nitrite reductase/ring-hydroxylating ferredoxin subunit
VNEPLPGQAPDAWRTLPNAPAAGTVVDTGKLKTVEACELTFGRGRSAFSAILVRTSEGPRAYLNRCPHFGLPLNSNPNCFIGEHGLLQCFRHFAVFRREDGMCVAGACPGAALERIPLSEDAAGVVRIG